MRIWQVIALAVTVVAGTPAAGDSHPAQLFESSSTGEKIRC
jgi:hypothetical protein